MLAFDLVTVTFFLVTTFMPVAGWILVADLVIAAGLSLELAARLYISPRPLQYLRPALAIVDLVVLASLLLPAFGPNLGFLRILRAVRLVALVQRAERARDRGALRPPQPSRAAGRGQSRRLCVHRQCDGLSSSSAT